MFGCCGFLSFSLVFCRFGGRLETTLYIHFIRRWVKSTRHSSARREGKDEKKGWKGRHSSQLSFAGPDCQQGGPAQLTTSASRTYWASPLLRRAHTASLTAGPPRLCARSLSRPPLRLSRRASPRKVECESEQADALCLHRCAATASTSLSMRGVRPVGVCVGFDAGLYRWRWLRLLQRLGHLSNLKPSFLHVSVYFLNCLLSIGAVLFT
jgi:hypothetical protein